MPIEQMDEILESQLVPEYRKIKIGDRGGKNGAPRRFDAPVITYPLKPSAGSAFETDERLMKRIREMQNLAEGAKVQEIPVRLLSDEIDDVLYVYRAMYNSYGRALCKSDLGNEKARRIFSHKEPSADSKVKGEKLGKFWILDTSYEVDCNSGCPAWGGKGEKTDCSWSAILNVQLECDPVFPEPTRFRTSGFTLIRYLRGSLNRLSKLTNGVLANIPLSLAIAEIETKRKKDKKIHPVMFFRFRGTLDQLRELTIAELESRRRLEAAKAGRPVDAAVAAPVISYGGFSASGDHGDDVAAAHDPADFLDFEVEEGVEAAEAPSVPRMSEADKDHVDEVTKEIADLVARTETSERGLEALYDKHKGDAEKVRDELKLIASGPAVKVEPATAEPANPRAGFEDVFEEEDEIWGVGSESNEPSETTEEKQEETSGNEGSSPDFDDDDFDIFKD